MRALGTDRLFHLFTATGRYPRMTLAVAALVVAFGVYGASRIEPTGSMDTMLAQDEPAPRALARIANHFGVTDKLIVLATVNADDKSGSSTGKEILRTFGQRLEAAVSQSPELAGLCESLTFADLPQARAFVQNEIAPAGLHYLDKAAWVQLEKRLSTAGIVGRIRRNEELMSMPGMAGAALTRALLKDPLGLQELLFSSRREGFPALNGGNASGLLLSDDGHTLMVRMTGAQPAARIEFSKRFLAAATTVVDRVNVDRLRIEYTGAYAIAVTAERAIRGDMIRSIVASLLLLGVAFMVVYRHGLSFPIAVLPVAGGIVTAFGLSSLYSTQLTPVVAVIGAVLAGLAIDYCIHFLTYFARERGEGKSHDEAVRQTLFGVGPAMMAACITSVVGFLALALSSVPALRQFALIGALGLFCSLIAAMTVLPALLRVVGAFSGGLAEPRLIRHGFARLLSRLAARPMRWIALTSAVGGAFLAVFILSPSGGWRFASDLATMHPRPNAPLDAQRRIGERFGRHPDALMIHLQADSAEALVSKAHEVQRRLRERMSPALGVAGVMGLGSWLPDPALVKSRNARVRAIDAQGVIADFRAALADSLFDPAAYDDYIEFLHEFLTRQNPPDVHTLLRYPRLAETMLPRGAVMAGELPTEGLAFVFLSHALDERGRRDSVISSIRDALVGVEGAILTGISVVGHDTERIVRRELRRLMGVAAVIVLIWLLIYFGRISDVLLALLPAVFGLACLAGLMTLLDLRLNMVNLIGLPLLVGIGVDDGIFLVSLVRRRGGNAEAPAVVMNRLGTACHAVMMTTLTTLLTFGTLSLTSTPAIRSLGVVLAVGMSACMIGTLFLLAPILLYTARLQRRTR